VVAAAGSGSGAGADNGGAAIKGNKIKISIHDSEVQD
jgi:hypothetical protein